MQADDAAEEQEEEDETARLFRLAAEQLKEKREEVAMSVEERSLTCGLAPAHCSGMRGRSQAAPGLKREHHWITSEHQKDRKPCCWVESSRGGLKMSCYAVRRYMQKWCKAWEDDLESRPAAVKSSGGGKGHPVLEGRRSCTASHSCCQGHRRGRQSICSYACLHSPDAYPACY